MLFRPAFLERALAGTHQPVLREVAAAAGFAERVDGVPLCTALDILYAVMVQHYRCEYVFKNCLLDTVMRTEDVSDIVVVDEFRAPECRPDVLVLNGTSCVYEIKSELDSFEKLHRQLAAHRKLFDRIYVVTSTGMLNACLCDVPDDIGVLLVDKDCRMRTLRSSRSHRDSVSPTHMFDCLRRSEYVAVIRRRFGVVPDVPPAHLRRACGTLFATLSPRQAHAEFTSCLKRRQEYMACAELLTRVPRSLLYLCASMSGKAGIASRVEEVLGGLGRLD